MLRAEEPLFASMLSLYCCRSTELRSEHGDVMCAKKNCPCRLRRFLLGAYRRAISVTVYDLYFTTIAGEPPAVGNRDLKNGLGRDKEGELTADSRLLGPFGECAV